nr:hypothetical protein Ade03nite_81950 [Actinoplanes derwentensis]
MPESAAPELGGITAGLGAAEAEVEAAAEDEEEREEWEEEETGGIAAGNRELVAEAEVAVIAMGEMEGVGAGACRSPYGKVIVALMDSADGVPVAGRLTCAASTSTDNRKRPAGTASAVSRTLSKRRRASWSRNGTPPKETDGSEDRPAAQRTWAARRPAAIDAAARSATTVAVSRQPAVTPMMISGFRTSPMASAAGDGSMRTG